MCYHTFPSQPWCWILSSVYCRIPSSVLSVFPPSFSQLGVLNRLQISQRINLTLLGHKTHHSCVFSPLPSICSFLINWAFAWLNLKRQREKSALCLDASRAISSQNYGFWKVKGKHFERDRNWKICKSGEIIETVWFKVYQGGKKYLFATASKLKVLQTCNARDC